MSSPRVSQQHLVQHLLPTLRSEGTRYRKTLAIRAREAQAGEEVVTYTSDGAETQQTAKADHVFVQAGTAAGECYLLKRKVFEARYESTEQLDKQMRSFNPTGQILALRVDFELLDQLGQKPEFLIEAPWGADMVVREGDMLATPLPSCHEIYRIAAREFGESYARSDGPESRS